MCKYFVIIQIVYLLCEFQTTFSKEIIQHQDASVTLKTVYGENEIKCLLVIDKSLDRRSIADVWNNIKQTTVNVWNSIQNLAKETRDRIKSWISKVKDEANRLKEAIVKQLQELKTKMVAAIQKAVGDGEKLKKCLEKQKKNIDKELKKVIGHVTDCISDRINKLSDLEKFSGFMLNETDFISKIEAKFNKCVEKGNNVEQCGQDIRKEIADESNNAEKNILKQRIESRQLADDILDAIVTCSMQGLIEAAAVITSITLDIIKCVIED